MKANLANRFILSPRSIALTTAAILISSQGAQAATRTWSGGGADINWNTPANWSAAIASGDTLVFAGSTKLTNNNNTTADTSYAGITFNAGAGAFVLNGNRITLGANIVNSGTDATLQTVNLDLILSANRQINVNGTASVQVNGIISQSSGNRTLTINNGGGDTGTVILTGANSYSGNTSISSGVLNIRNASALGTIANGTTVSSGAALEIQGGITTLAEALAIDGTGISNGGALRNISGSNTYAGAITINSATRINSDSGTLTLDVASGNAITGSNDNLTFGGAGNITVADAIATGSGALTKDGAGTLTLTGTNTFTGATTISNGTLSVATIGNGGASGNLGQASTTAANLTLSGGTLQYTGSTAGTNRNFVLTAATSSTIDVTTNNLTISGASTNTSGALTKDGAGTLTLSGNNLHTGLTTVSNGTLAYGITNALSSGAVTVNGASAVLSMGTFSDTVGAVTLSNGSITGSTGVLTGTSYAMHMGSVSAILGGTGALTKTTVDTVTLSGTNSYTGVTSINAGTLSVATIGNGGVAGNLGQAATTASNLVLGGGTLQYTGATASTNRNFTLTAATTSTIEVTTNNLTITGGSANTSGALEKTGAGTLTLNGTNSHTGLTTISNGTLALGAAGTIANTAGIVLNGGNFNVSAASPFSLGTGQILSGNGSVTGNITINGTLAIGASPGTVTFNNNLGLGASAISDFELTSGAFTLGSYDLAQGGAGVQGVTFGGILNLYFSGGTYANGSSVKIFDFENYAGTFSAVNFSGLNVGQSAAFDTFSGVVTVVPEPSTWMSLLCGSLVLLGVRRRG